MKQNKRLFSLASFFCALALFIFALLPIPAFANTRPRRTVRVAYPIQAGLTNVDENGNFSGYTYEYLEEVAQYTGWDYEFVQVPGDSSQQLDTLLGMLIEGEVDLMGGMMYSEDLVEYFNYSGYSYGTSETVLQTLTESANSVMVDSQKNQILRFAVRSTATRSREELLEYCEMNLIDPVMVECDTDAEMVEALREGKADYLLNASLNYIDGVRTVARFSPKPFFFVVSKTGGDGLVKELNEAILSINQSDPFFQTTLYEKYFSPQKASLTFTREEEDFIQSAGELRVGVFTRQPPYQYQNDAGELTGIGVNLLNYVSQKTGLAFSFLGASSMEELYGMAQRGEVDLIAGMHYDYATARQKNLAMTRPYLSSSYLLVMNGDGSDESIRGKRLAMPRTSAYDGYFLGNAQWYDDLDSCLRAVQKGEADYAYVDTYTAQYYLNLPGYQGLKMIPQSYDPHRVSFGVSKDSDTALLGILNKVLLDISDDDLQGIILTNAIPQRDFTLQELIRRHPLESFLLLLGVFLVILSLLSVILYQRVRTERALSFELEKHLRLYGVANDRLFEFDYRDNSLLISTINEEGKREAKAYRIGTGRPMGDDLENEEKFLRILRSGKNCVSDELLRFFDGEKHWVRITLETINGDGGEPVYAIGKINIIDSEVEEKEDLLERAQRDSLTHLYNNESSVRLITEALGQPGEGIGALALVDVDHFKDINDTYGHLYGDRALQAVARILSDFCGEDGLCARPGGDEFLFFIRVPDREELEERCRRLQSAVRQVEVEGRRVLTLSVGAALAKPGVSFEELYRRADRALYRAKAAGRDRYEFWEEGDPR